MSIRNVKDQLVTAKTNKLTWATITALTGTPRRYAYTDGNGIAWFAFRWTGPGSLTCTAGVVDALLIGGGSGGIGGGISWQGGPGSLLDGLLALSAATHAITIGAAGALGADQQPTSYVGGDTRLGKYNANGGQVEVTGAGYRRGTEAWTGDGFGSLITGTLLYFGGCGRYNGSVVAGLGYGVANSGSGAYVNETGQAGTAIVRVPEAFVSATSGWT